MHAIAHSLLVILATLVQGPATTQSLPDAPGYSRPYEVDWARGLTEGLGEVEVSGKWGYIDARGKLAIEPRYDQAMPFSEGVAPVRAGTVIDTPKAALFGLAGSWRFIGRDGTKFGREFTMSLPFSEGLAAVGLGGAHAMDRPPKFGYFSLQGTLAIPAQFMSCQPFSEGLAVVEAMTQLKGYVDLRGNAVIPARYRWAGKFSRGRALVLEGDDHFIINAKGEQVAALACDQVQAFAFFEGMSAIAQHGKWGC
jgi:hypothetical protein